MIFTAIAGKLKRRTEDDHFEDWPIIRTVRCICAIIVRLSSRLGA